ncbi:hypothetical protein EV213_11015 [Aureibacillus halotolerans]|uniref:Uncharacterized protein n=1 Tax=Aureibacillus halotolerans TaxID=1508390 RepID=A0A4V3D505_9BACI|nr:hypothetical protein EV213_11015 [Aureibacillus halotolerans]
MPRPQPRTSKNAHTANRQEMMIVNKENQQKETLQPTEQSKEIEHTTPHPNIEREDETIKNTSS